MLRLRKERISRGWTQEYVAEQIGTSHSAVQMMETGQRNPSYPLLIRIEDLFGMTHRELFADE